MRRLSGDFLSRVLLVLQRCNEREVTPQELMAALQSALGADDLYVEVDDAVPARDVTEPMPTRLKTFDAASMGKLNAMLPWSSYTPLGGSHVVGSAWSGRKRIAPEVFPDALVERLAARLPLGGKDVLELGCFEGHHSTTLARHARSVWAIDGRIENVVKTLVRVWLAGAEQRVAVNLLDLERGPLGEQLAALGRTAKFEVIHHRGVLYHLSDPVAHLAQCAEVCTEAIYLHTQLAPERLVDSTLQHGGRTYPVYRYREPKVEFAPFSGITTYAHWFTEASLTAALQDLGFGDIEVLARVEERNGPRLECIARRR